MYASWEWIPLLLALGIALFLRPWRMLRRTELLTPLLASLVIVPWVWAMPRPHTMPLQLTLTFSGIILLTLGWPLAIPVFCLIAIISGLLAPAPVAQLMADAFWLGVLPATFAMLLGALVRRYLGPNIFVYTLGRGFFTTVASVFAAALLSEWAGYHLPNIDPSLTTIAHWLIAWGDGFMTGLLSAIFVAFRPQWLATWSDELYLRSS